jgi:hypothetical protein
MSSSWTMRSAPTRRQKRGRLWQLRPVVLPRGTRQCTIMAPLTCLTSISSSSGLPAHLSASTSKQHLRLYPHLRLRYACLRHRPLDPPLATPASIVVARATSLESAPRQRKTPLRAMPLIRHVVHRRWSLQRPIASTTPLWRTFSRMSKSSWVRFL